MLPHSLRVAVGVQIYSVVSQHTQMNCVRVGMPRSLELPHVHGVATTARIVSVSAALVVAVVRFSVGFVVGVGVAAPALPRENMSGAQDKLSGGGIRSAWRSLSRAHRCMAALGAIA